MVVDPQQIASQNGQLTRGKATAELGNSGLHRWGGRIHEEFLVELQGLRGVRVYEEMRKNDPVIGSVLTGTKATVRSVSWNTEPADDSPEAAKWAEFAGQCMDDMSMTWQDFIGEALTCIPFGWAAHEACYKIRAGEDAEYPSKYDDGLIGWRKFPLRKQDSLREWIIDDNGGLQGMVQIAQPSYKAIALPINKLLLFRLDQEANNPEGISMLRTSYKPWYFKKQHEEIEGIGLERDFTGFMHIRLPMNATNADYDVALDILERAKTDEQAGMVTQKGPSERDDWQVDLLASPGSKAIDVDKAIRRYSAEISTSFLAQFLRLGQDGRAGSYALSETQRDFFYLSIQTILDIFEETINRYMVAPLMRLNGVPTMLYPKIAHGRIAAREMEPLMNMLKILFDTGLLGAVDDKLVQFLRAEADLPPAPETTPVEGQLHEPRRWLPLRESDLSGWV